MDIHKFCVAGINYKKADAELRSLFAVNEDQYACILKNALSFGLKEVFVLSTCNRTEIYGLTENAEDLIQLLCAETPGSTQMFKKSAYIKKGREAIEHLFDVAAGLDSQILGDYEIVGQIKSAAKFARQHGFLGAYLDRLVNSVLQSSKLIKNNTALSGGTVSVAFAATQYIKKHVKDISNKKILLLGTGKIGSSACKNLVDYLDTKNITLINRSPEKALELATELGLKTASINDVETEVNTADIIVVATNAAQPVILASHITSHQPKLIIDLSIPFNVEESVRHLPGMQLVNVDELSKLKDETLKKREAEVPKARAIITESMQDFIEWYYMRRHVPMLKDLKSKLKELHSYTFIADANNPICESKINIKIQRVVNETACRIKETNTRGCHYIAAINDFICTA